MYHRGIEFIDPTHNNLHSGVVTFNVADNSDEAKYAARVNATYRLRINPERGIEVDQKADNGTWMTIMQRASTEWLEAWLSKRAGQPWTYEQFVEATTLWGDGYKRGNDAGYREGRNDGIAEGKKAQL